MSEVTLQLIDDLIVVRPQEEKRGKIVKPDWAKALTGVVVAVGPGKFLRDGKTRREMQCQEGDIVTFGAAKGMESSWGAGMPVRVMRDTDVDLVIGSVRDGHSEVHE